MVHLSIRQLIYILLIAIALLYVFFFIYLITQTKKVTQPISYPIPPIKENTHQKNTPGKEQVKPENSSLTDFFIKSKEFAIKVLDGNAFIDQFGNEIVETINKVNKLNAATRKQISISIDQTGSDKVFSNSTEEQLRNIAQSERLPLWFVIYRLAVEKSLSSSANKNLSYLSDEEILSEINARKGIVKPPVEETPKGKIISINSAS